MAARKEELLLRSRGRVAWTIVALCCGSHASHILHSLGIQALGAVVAGVDYRDQYHSEAYYARDDEGGTSAAGR